MRDRAIRIHKSMSETPNTKGVASVPSGVGDAVGVAGRMWFVAIVNNNTEKSAQEKLTKLNYETYVAKQKVLRVWKNGKKAKIDKVVVHSVVFIHCTEKERKDIVNLPFINRFMTNKAGVSTNGLTKPLAVIPQAQIDTLRFMLGQSDIPVTFVDAPYKVHDKIKIIRGNLKGLEGEIIQTDNGKSELIVRVDILGCARMLIDATDIEPAR